MTPEAQRIALAELGGKNNLWVLKKRGLFYRPQAQGYAVDIRDAWIVDSTTADKYVYPYDEPVTKHPAPLPDYLHDLNAIHELESTLSTNQYTDFVEWLSEIRTQGCEDVCRCPSATPHQRAEALLRTLDRWKEDE